MFQDKKETQTVPETVDQLEPYRRLIELQKQMIELVQQHEKTKRECGALRAQVMKEMAGRRSRWCWRSEIARATGNSLKGLTIFWISWKSRAQNRPQPPGLLSPRNRLLKI